MVKLQFYSSQAGDPGIDGESGVSGFGLAKGGGVGFGRQGGHPGGIYVLRMPTYGWSIEIKNMYAH